MKNKIAALPNMYSVAPGIWGMKDVFVNFYIVKNLENDNWVLIDTGLKWSYSKIKKMAASIFGENSIPKAIVLTHGHFDHVGSVAKLADEWEVPVYAHHLEIPYLTAQSDYPPPDASVGGGMMATMAFIYPKSPINIWRHLKVLPADGSIPVLAGWRYIHTPGHSPGHISLYREIDKVLIAGDAFVTTNQESATSVMFQKKILHGPPKYFTCDWQAAKTSVEKLNKLNPSVAATGHGKPMEGKKLTKALQNLNSNFYNKAMPSKGRYVPYPAITDANGVVYLPPEKSNGNEKMVAAFGITALIATGLFWFGYKKKRKKIMYETFMDVEYNY